MSCTTQRSPVPLWHTCTVTLPSQHYILTTSFIMWYIPTDNDKLGTFLWWLAFAQSKHSSAKLFSSRRNWTPSTWGEGHTRWRERGWENPNSDERTYTVGSLYTCIYVLCEPSPGSLAPAIVGGGGVSTYCKYKKITLLTVSVLFLFAFFNLILDATRRYLKILLSSSSCNLCMGSARRPVPKIYINKGTWQRDFLP